MFNRLAAMVAGLPMAACATPALVDDDVVSVFRNVQVLTMTDAGRIMNATVTVDGARVIDGAGRTLMPGLADMHVHYGSEKEGVLYLANSVTSVRNLWGSGRTLIFDAGAKRGDLTGPHIYTSGPLMDGPEPIWGGASLQVTTPEQAIGAVESQRTTGYRAVKLYEGLPPEIYAAAVKAAKDRDMQVWTHVPEGMSVEEVIDLGVDSIEHFEGVSSAANAGPEDAGYMARWANADHERLREIANASAARVCGTRRRSR